jgi:hypothetical protein
MEAAKAKDQEEVEEEVEEEEEVVVGWNRLSLLQYPGDPNPIRKRYVFYFVGERAFSSVSSLQQSSQAGSCEEVAFFRFKQTAVQYR